MNLNEEIIKVLLKIAKRGEGALIVVGECKYKPLVEQSVPPFEVMKNPKLLESLALMDGAVIVKNNGMMEAYGVMIKANMLSMIKNLGTRHNSGMSASMTRGTTAYVLSEEEGKIRIYKEGKLVLEIDGKNKEVEKRIPEITKIMESVGWGTATMVGVGLLAPAIGIVAIPGITIFAVGSGAVYLLKKLKEWGIGK